MGFPTSNFVKSVDPNLICGICSGVLDVPTLTPCGHTFCDDCISTWLDTAHVSTCPECRSRMDKDSVRPILSLRNFIYSLEVICPNKGRGCEEITTIESREAHVNVCQYRAVTCDRCHWHAEKSQSLEHDLSCVASRSAASPEDIECNPKDINSSCSMQRVNTKASSLITRMASSVSIDESGSAHIRYLLQRINTLENQVTRLLNDLHEAHRKNSLLYFQNRQLKECNAERCQKTRSSSDARLGLSTRPSEYSIACQQDIAKLSLHIARYLLQKPANVDGDRVFQAVRQCYELQFYPNGKDSTIDHDIHMLLATAYSSNWFTSAQRILLGCWLQCVQKNQEEISR